MGPYQHDSSKAKIDEMNKADTDGLKFVEFAHPEPGKLEVLFESIG